MKPVVLLLAVLLMVPLLYGCSEPAPSGPPVTITSSERETSSDAQKGVHVERTEMPKSAYKTRWMGPASEYGPSSVTGKVVEVTYFDHNTLIRFEDGDYVIARGYTLRAIPGSVVKVEGDLDSGGCLTTGYNARPVVITELESQK